MVHIEEDYDIVVAGAGPAGLCSAKGAAENGARVLVLEEHAAIGTPVQCGELFTRSALEELGIDGKPSWMMNEFRRVKVHSPNGVLAEINMPEDVPPPLFVIERRTWEKELARDVAAAGATVVTKARVLRPMVGHGVVKGVEFERFGKRHKVSSSVLICCDGPGSPIGRRAGLPVPTDPGMYASIAQHQLGGLDIDPDIGEVHFSPTPADVIYILPKGGGLANVGYGRLGSRMMETTTLAMLDRFIAGHKILRKGAIIETNAGLAPVGGPVERMAGDGVMLVGDAAGMTNPLTAAGMRFCIWSGLRAGRLAADAANGGDVSSDVLLGLQREWEAKFGKRMRRMKALREIVFALGPEEMDDLFKVVGSVDIPESVFKGKREPVYYGIKMIFKMVLKSPRLAWRFKGAI